MIISFTAEMAGATADDGHMISNEEGKRTLTLIVATKATWWLTNHTGQGEVIGYTRKVLVAQFGSQATQEAITMAHTIGHWASTIGILSLTTLQGWRVPTNAPLHLS